MAISISAVNTGFPHLDYYKTLWKLSFKGSPKQGWQHTTSPENLLLPLATISVTLCVLLFFPLKHYKHLQEFQIALKTMNASPPLRRVWWGQLLAAILVSAMTQWSSAPSEKDEGLSRAC